ncbi:cytochrome c oxidase subunit III [Mycolicibacterium anyangense]|uniref:Probable cytochrome c oxidase subunit 3 n=1 Tax=Mycolicibacterium anyangense TaxID=1431246 RepID=A0A6N4W471_9MYCO|nr:cytochrome c oxidase subunit III [Mycolicibacterium anyangense]
MPAPELVATPTSAGSHARRLPGVDGVWVAIGADAVFFAILFLTFMQDRLKDPALFEASRHTLNPNFGGIDTVILLTSSWCVAIAIQALKRDLPGAASRYLLGAVLTGLMFVVSKGIEYFLKFSHGITPATNSFFMWYFTLTGIHLIHVVFGTGLLTFVWCKARTGSYHSSNRVVPECVASYWHLVDMLWVVLFPLLYLLRAG